MSSRDILQGDFLKFIWFVWTRVLSLPKPTRIQLDIARYLAGGPRRRFIQAFRGIGKTFLTAAYVVWRLWKNPQLKIVIVSANETFATEIATFIKQIIDHPSGDDLWPELRSKPGQRTSAMAFDVGAAKETPDKSPSVKAMGITGQLTGSRADILISDDVEVPKNSATETMRELLKQRTEEYAALMKTGGQTETIYLGTPQTQESVYRDLPKKGYGVRIWTARYPLRDKLATFEGMLAPMLLADIEADPSLCESTGSAAGGAPTDPERFTDIDLIERETEYRLSGFLLQFMLDTSVSDGDRYPLKTRDLIVMDVPRDMAPVRVAWAAGPDQVIKDQALPNVGFDGDRFHRPMYVSNDFDDYTGAVMHIDPSGRGKDETTYAVTKFLNGMIYLRRWGGLQDGYSPETLRALAEIAAEEKVTLIVPEDNFGDGMFGRLLEPVVARVYGSKIVDGRKLPACPIEGKKVQGQKEVRICSILEPVMSQHRLVVDTSVIRKDLAGTDSVKCGIYQMTHMSKRRGALKHDDRIDVLAQACGHWTDYLNRDQLKAEEDWVKQQQAEFDRRYFEGTNLETAFARGSSPKGRIIGSALMAGRRVRR